MTITRTMCPLDCGWHHDQDDSVEPPQVTVDADVLASRDLAAINTAVTMATMLALLAPVESALKTHLETHELIEWVEALTTAQRRAERAERALTAVDASMRQADLGPALAGIHDALTDWKAGR